MRRVLAILMGIGGVGLLTVPAAAKSGKTGASFLKIAPGARAAALGESFTAVADDASAVLWNPAGLGRLLKPTVTATHTQWVQQTKHDFLAGTQPTSWGTLGLGVVSFSVSDIERRTTDTDTPDGTFDSRDAAYTFAWGKSLGESWSLGLGATYVRQTLDGHSAGAPAATLGALWNTPWRPLTAGVAVRNLGGEIKFDQEGDPLPTTLAAGLALRPWGDRFLFSTDVRLPSSESVSASAGMELSRRLFKDGRGHLRAGYNSAVSDVQDATGLSLGLGLDFNRWGLGLAWTPYGVLGDSFRYAFHASF
jgi:hypothetical protein